MAVVEGSVFAGSLHHCSEFESCARQHHCDLIDAVPVRTGDKLQLSVRVPAGIHAGIVPPGQRWRPAAGGEDGGRRIPSVHGFPCKGRYGAPWSVRPARKCVLALGVRLAPPDLAALKSLLADGAAWPPLPSDSVLRLTPTEVAVDQTSRNLGDPEKTGDPEGQVCSRLELLRTLLSDKCESLTGLAFSHQP